jgi:predicted transcriptional regulator
VNERLNPALTPGQRWYRDHRETELAKLRAWRAANPEKVKASRHAFYLRHRETMLAKAKEKERKKRIALREQLRLTREELAACLKDPTQVWIIRGPKWIACLECGALCENLPPHLWQCHHLTAEEYKAKPGLSGVRRYNKNASLTSKDLQARRSRISTELGLGKRLQASGKVPDLRKLIASRGKRVFSQQYRLEQSRRLKGRPSSGKQTGARPALQKIREREFLQIVALGLPTAKAAKSLDVSQTTFRNYARKFGCDIGVAQRQRRWILRLVSEVRKWITLQAQIPTVEEIAHCLRDVRKRSGLLSPSELSFFIQLEADLGERPEGIDELAVKGAAHKIGPKMISMANRVFQRSRKKPAHQLAAPSQGAKGGRPKGAKDPDTDPRIWLAAALSVLGYSEYSMAPRLYPKATKTSAEKNTDTFLRRNREEFEKRKGALNKQQAEDIVKKRMS